MKLLVPSAWKLREGKVAFIQTAMWVDELVSPGTAAATQAAATQAAFVTGLDLAPIVQVEDAPCFEAALVIHQSLLTIDSSATAQGKVLTKASERWLRAWGGAGGTRHRDASGWKPDKRR